MATKSPTPWGSTPTESFAVAHRTSPASSTAWMDPKRGLNTKLVGSPGTSPDSDVGDPVESRTRRRPILEMIAATAAGRRRWMNRSRNIRNEAMLAMTVSATRSTPRLGTKSGTTSWRSTSAHVNAPTRMASTVFSSGSRYQRRM
jgi:hypothetical protein